MLAPVAFVLSLAAMASALPTFSTRAVANETAPATPYCGTAPYDPAAYKCWSGSLLCPSDTMPCGGSPSNLACYKPTEYR